MKTVVLGISGSIAVGKTIDLIKQLKLHFNVEVIMTRSAKQLLNKDVLAGLCPVHDELFDPDLQWSDYISRVDHISLSDKADVILIAPATANTIAKIAHGICDDYLTTTVLATRCPILIAPAMNCKMYENPITQKNISALKERGMRFLGPGYGDLACGYKGIGRLLEPEDIVKQVHEEIARLDTYNEKKLQGKTVLITSGPTYEEIDPVRIITNKSSGKMGNALAKHAIELGADVIHVQGPMTTQEMYEKVRKHFAACDVFVSCAAVCDFKPVYQEHKIKKTDDDRITLEFTKNVDILAQMGKLKSPHQKIIGFALESENLIANAQKKLERKNCDLIVANDIRSPGSDQITATLVSREGIEALPHLSKEELAQKLFSLII